jgi:hypothetical protein
MSSISRSNSLQKVSGCLTQNAWDWPNKDAKNRKTRTPLAAADCSAAFASGYFAGPPVGLQHVLIPDDPTHSWSKMFAPAM